MLEEEQRKFSSLDGVRRNLGSACGFWWARSLVSLLPTLVFNTLTEEPMAVKLVVLKGVICCPRDDIKQTHCTARPMVGWIQSLVPPRSACGRSGEEEQTEVCHGRPSAPHIPQRITRAWRLSYLNPTVRDCIHVTSSGIRNATVACV